MDGLIFCLLNVTTMFLLIFVCALKMVESSLPSSDNGKEDEQTRKIEKTGWEDKK